MDSLVEPTEAINWGWGLILFSSTMATTESSIVVVPVLVVISSMSAISVIGCFRAPNVIFVPTGHHPAPFLSLPNRDLPTPVRLKRLAPLLTRHLLSETQFLICGFQNGFLIHYDGPGNATMAPNLLWAHQHPEVVDQYIEKEFSSWCIAGPFPCPQFPSFRVSPLGVVPKKTPGKFRLIQHLVYPPGTPVNDYNPTEHTSITLSRVDDAVRLITQSGVDSFLAKTDIKGAFRIIPIRPKHYHLLGMR